MSKGSRTKKHNINSPYYSEIMGSAIGSRKINIFFNKINLFRENYILDSIFFLVYRP